MEKRELALMKITRFERGRSKVHPSNGQSFINPVWFFLPFNYAYVSISLGYYPPPPPPATRILPAFRTFAVRPWIRGGRDAALCTLWDIMEN